MRNAEKSQRRLHVPMVNRTPGIDQAPPVLVAVAGPPGVSYRFVDYTSAYQLLGW